ncbi:MAG: hypothetical protein CL676_03465 [Bdellovibrionaceae bacterium]|nr:hypothetical protein [Pseudobdellovibrionaceae bacterium]|tara:strand:+ start:5117 stop:5608 length:492 start_codon:yes stop_codon:yes gene_type:complete
METSKPIIRTSTLNDKLSVKDAHIRSIHQICSKDYTQKQIEAWAQPPYSDDVWERAVNRQLHQVVELDGKIEGFCHSTVHEDGTGEILGLYLTPEVAGLGVGKKMVQQALEYINTFKPRKIVVESTITAKGFYERMGFKLVHEILDHKIRGEIIQCFRMEKMP